MWTCLASSQPPTNPPGFPCNVSLSRKAPYVPCVLVAAGGGGGVGKQASTVAECVRRPRWSVWAIRTAIRTPTPRERRASVDKACSSLLPIMDSGEEADHLLPLDAERQAADGQQPSAQQQHARRSEESKDSSLALSLLYWGVYSVNGGLVGALGPSLESFERATGLSEAAMAQMIMQVHRSRAASFLLRRVLSSRGGRTSPPRPHVCAPLLTTSACRRVRRIGWPRWWASACGRSTRNDARREAHPGSSPTRCSASHSSRPPSATR